MLGFDAAYLTDERMDKITAEVETVLRAQTLPKVLRFVGGDVMKLSRSRGDKDHREPLTLDQFFVSTKEAEN